MKLLGLVCVATVLVSCFPRNAPLEPNFSCVPCREEVSSLPPPFPPLTHDERGQDWAKEYRIGVVFGRDLDLYRAITAFKRAYALLDDDDLERRAEVAYHIAHAYYLGGRYCDVIETVETTPLNRVGPSFYAYHDLLLMLYDSYSQTGDTRAAEFIFKKLYCEDSQTALDVSYSYALTTGDISKVDKVAQRTGDTELCELVTSFNRCYKSPGKAQIANALLPGAGYWYVGQRHTAVTAFVLNSLFLAATYQLMHNGQYALGAFAASLEIGWYIGGIYGAGESAHLHNELCYEKLTRPHLEQKRLFPCVMLRFGF